MRWFHLTVIVLFAALTALFAMQTFQIVTVSFLRIGAEMPLTFLIAIIYLLGAATGSSLSGHGGCKKTGICHLGLRDVLLVEWDEALEASRASAKQWLWAIRYACSAKQYWPALGWPGELFRGRSNFLT